MATRTRSLWAQITAITNTSSSPVTSPPARGRGAGCQPHLHLDELAAIYHPAGEGPSTNIQDPEKIQDPNPKLQMPTRHSDGFPQFWDLRFYWDLEFGICNWIPITQ